MVGQVLGQLRASLYLRVELAASVQQSGVLCSCIHCAVWARWIVLWILRPLLEALNKDVYLFFTGINISRHVRLLLFLKQKITIPINRKKPPN
jgi:hypothetical protein